MCLVNLVDLISLPFLFASHINPDVPCPLTLALLLSSAPFVLVHPLFWCVISFSDPISLASFYSGILIDWTHGNLQVARMDYTHDGLLV